jgi:hypothetical protein
LDDDTTVCRRLGVYGVNEDFAVFKTDRRDLVVDLLLTVTWLPILSFSAMYESRVFVVKAM